LLPLTQPSSLDFG